MQLVLQGKRANRYVAIGKNRVKRYRDFKVKFGTCAIRVPGGYVIAQVAGDIGRVIVQVADPYMVVSVTLAAKPPKVGVLYVPYEGGVIDEAFEPTGYNGTAVVGTQYSACNKFVAVGEHILTIFTLSNGEGDRYRATYISKINTTTGQTSFVYGGSTEFPDAIGSLPAISMIPVGYVGPGQASKNTGNLYAAFIFPIYGGDDKLLFPAVAVVRVSANDADISSEAYAVWPPAGANHGKLNKLPIQLGLTTAGRNKIAFFQAYNDPDDATDYQLPVIVVYDLLLNSYTQCSIDTILPLPPDPPTAVPDNYYIANADLGYCGNGVLMVAYSITGTAYDEENPFVYRASPGTVVGRSTDNGATFTNISSAIGVPAGYRLINTLYGNEHSFLSLAPGKLWLYTTNQDPFNPDAPHDIRLFVTEDYGVTWSNSVIAVNTLSADGSWVLVGDELSSYYGAITPVHNKYRSGDVMAATRGNTAGDRTVIDIYESFSPSAKRLSKTVLPAKIAPAFPANYATFFDRVAPILPGHPGELEDVGAPE